MTAVRCQRAAAHGARLLLALLAAWAVGQAFAQETAERGAQLYEQHCASCHQAEGEGVEDAYPALAGNEVVVGEPHDAIRPPLVGPGAMPSFADTLSDEEIAAVVSHVRTSWGNEAEPVSAEDVAAVRQEVGDEADAEDAAAEEDAGAEADADEREDAAAEEDVTPDPDADEADDGAEPSDDEPDEDPEEQEQAEEEQEEQAEDEAAEDERAVPADFDWQEAGQGLFEEYCAACHQSEGQGAGGVFPPLAGNPFVTADPGDVVHTVLFGRAGMPSFQSLDDEEIAAVVSYIRNAWSNDASVVTPDQVTEHREEGVLDPADDDEDRPGAAD